MFAFFMPSLASPSLEYALCGDVGATLILTGALFMLSSGVALMITVVPRERFTVSIKALMEGNPLAFITPEIDHFRHSFQIKLPRCGVVMPVKGVHEQSYSNWCSHISSMYGGQLEFYFCVESEADPAYPHIQRLIREHPETRIHLLAAGLTWHCTQKHHNFLHAFEIAIRACEYVLVLDDDCQLHPGTIRSWVEVLESDANCLAASGYPFEYVRKGETSWCPYFMMLWRMMASNGFSEPSKDRPPNVWGGAMFFRSRDMRENVYGLPDAWADGGYSEDFMTMSFARYYKRSIAVPKSALFPNELGNIEFSRFWNFMCRQVFVLTQTYSSGTQRFVAVLSMFVNAAMHFFISAATVGTVVLVAYLAGANMPGGGARSGGDGSQKDSAAPFARLGAVGECGSSVAIPGAALFVLSLAFFGYVGKRILVSFATLCNTLSPHGYSNEPIDVSHITMRSLVASYLLYAPLIPLASVATLTSNSVIWSGVRYTVTGGRISSVHRKDANGNWYTQPREVSLEKSLKETAQRRLQLDGLVR